MSLEGSLRVGINFGNVVLAKRNADGSPCGIAVDLANELTGRLKVTMEIVGYEAAGRMADGAKAGEWDVAFLAADPERAEEIDFTPPYLEVETTYLVWAGSTFRMIEDIDATGVRISVSKKSAYDLYLTRTLRNGQLVRAPGPEASIDLFFREKLDALAGLRPVLINVAQKHHGTRVIEGHFMSVRQAIGVPKGRKAADSYLCEFVEDIRASGFVTRIIEKNGIQGVTVM